MRGEEARERIRRIFENGPRLAGFYSFAINNPHLSFWNAVQIYSANPNVTVCKSFDDWHEQDNRRIKRAEHGIVYYDEDNPWRKRHVFDISQTYGKERYRGVQHRMREKMLADCINGQNIFAGISRDEESPVKTAVRRYCQEHYLNSEGTEEYNEQYLSCLTEGVTRCICTFTGNTYDDVGALPFDEDTNYIHQTEKFLKTIVIDIKLTKEYLLSYAPYQEKNEPEEEKEPEMERIPTASYGPAFAGQFKSYDQAKISPLDVKNMYKWKVQPSSSLEIFNPPMKPIESYHADAIQESVNRLNGLIEDEKKGIQDVLNRIKNMEKQRNKLQAAIKALK